MPHCIFCSQYVVVLELNTQQRYRPALLLTWYKILTRSSGAVTLRATEPATAPHTNSSYQALLFNASGGGCDLAADDAASVTLTAIVCGSGLWLDDAMLHATIQYPLFVDEI